MAFKHDLDAAATQAMLADAIRPYDRKQAAQHFRNAIHYMRKAAEGAGYLLEDAPEPEPLDAETVAARQHSHDEGIRDAGRGHLIG